MGYDRTPRGTGWRGDDYQRTDYGTRRDGNYSSAREYEASGAYDRDNDDRGGRYGQSRYSQSGYGQSDYGRRGDYGGQNYGSRDFGGGYERGQSQYARGDEYHGSYASDGRRFEDVGDRRDWDDDNRASSRSYGQANYGQAGGGRDYGRERDRSQGGDRGPNRSYGGQPQGYDYQERGFFNRAGDEVRSWFGDQEAERRREMDSRYDERSATGRGGDDHSDYHHWRSQQIAAFDRDYDEYRSENRTKFHNEFSSWRTARQGQRDQLSQVKEHTDVVGSDGAHVGTVDKVRDDRIILTKNDADAGGRHHSIPSRWIQSVDASKVTLSKTADEAKQHWRDEEQNQALFGDRDRQQSAASSASSSTTTDQNASGGTNLNRSFSGTY